MLGAGDDAEPDWNSIGTGPESATAATVQGGSCAIRRSLAQDHGDERDHLHPYKGAERRGTVSASGRSPGGVLWRFGSEPLGEKEEASGRQVTGERVLTHSLSAS